MLKQRTAGTHPISAQQCTSWFAKKLAVPSIPIQKRLLYRPPHGIGRDSTRLLLCEGANGSQGRHFVNGRQNGGSEMHSSKMSVAKWVGYRQYHCVARLYSRCAANSQSRTQGYSWSPVRFLKHLVLPVADHKLGYVAKCSPVRQGGSA